MSELSMETPGEDAAEQALAVSPEEGGADTDQALSVPLEVDEADAAEQIRDVGYGDEDYR